MKGSALNSNNDLIIENGQIKLVDKAAEVAQHVRTRLQLFLGECFFDVNTGIPYFQSILTKPVNLDNIESILKQTILETDDVLRLETFEMQFSDTEERKLVVNSNVETVYGIINVSGVTVNV